MKIYIAGPITGNPNYIKDFEQAENALKEKGHAVINPVKNQGFSYKDYIDMGLAELSKCDAIFHLNGWRKSNGATLEHEYAVIVGIKPFYNLYNVPDAPDKEGKNAKRDT